MISELMMRRYDQYLQEDASFKNVLKVDLTRQFWDDMDKRVNDSINNFFVLFVFGEQGSAKSGVAQSIMQRYNPGFCAENIVFSNRELIERIKDSREGDCYIKDEMPLQYGSGSMIDQKMIQNFIAQMRASRVNFIFINPTRVNVQGCHYLLHTLLFDEKERKVRAGILDSYYFRYLGFVDFDLKPIWNNRLWQDYVRVKDAFLEQTKKQDYISLDLTKSARLVINHERFQRCLSPKGKLVSGYVRNLITELFPNIGIERQKSIYFKVKELLEHGEEGEGSIPSVS